MPVEEHIPPQEQEHLHRILEQCWLMKRTGAGIRSILEHIEQGLSSFWDMIYQDGKPKDAMLRAAFYIQLISTTLDELDVEYRERAELVLDELHCIRVEASTKILPYKLIFQKTREDVKWIKERHKTSRFFKEIDRSKYERFVFLLEPSILKVAGRLIEAATAFDEKLLVLQTPSALARHHRDRIVDFALLKDLSKFEEAVRAALNDISTGRIFAGGQAAVFSGLTTAFTLLEQPERAVHNLELAEKLRDHLMPFSEETYSFLNAQLLYYSRNHPNEVENIVRSSHELGVFIGDQYIRPQQYRINELKRHVASPLVKEHIKTIRPIPLPRLVW